MRPSKKSEILETASKLFCQYGFQATGIDRVIAESGIAKMTLYSNFKSKEELIVACLQKLDEEGYQWFVEQVQGSGKDAKSRLRNIFNVWSNYITSKNFFGCPFLRAATEYGDLQHVIHQQAIAHKKAMQLFLENLCKEAAVKNPKTSAIKIQMLMEGSAALTQLHGSDQFTKLASEMLLKL